MKKKKICLNVLLTLLLSFSFSSFLFNTVNASNVRSGTFETYFPNGSSLGFQNPPNYVLLSITSGNLNSSNSILYLHTGGGYFRFTSNESVTLQITYNVTTVKVAGDNGNEIRSIRNGSSFSFSQNDNAQIIWDLTTGVWLPIQFIFGMVGLISMFGGSLMGINYFKKGEYEEGLRFSAIWIAFGVALTIAWLWA